MKKTLFLGAIAMAVVFAFAGKSVKAAVQEPAAGGFHCDPPDTRVCAEKDGWTLYGTPHVEMNN